MQWKIQLAHIKEARKVTIQILFRSKYKKSKENIENFDKQIRIERNRSGRMRGSKRVERTKWETKEYTVSTITEMWNTIRELLTYGCYVNINIRSKAFQRFFWLKWWQHRWRQRYNTVTIPQPRSNQCLPIELAKALLKTKNLYQKVDTPINTRCLQYI